MKKRGISILLIVAILAGLFAGCASKTTQYERAAALFNEEKFAEAAEAFDALGDFMDAPDRAEEARDAEEFKWFKISVRAEIESRVTSFHSGLLDGRYSAAQSVFNEQLDKYLLWKDAEYLTLDEIDTEIAEFVFEAHKNGLINMGLRLTTHFTEKEGYDFAIKLFEEIVELDDDFNDVVDKLKESRDASR